jgi:hypothetical protein
MELQPHRQRVDSSQIGGNKFIARGERTDHLHPGRNAVRSRPMNEDPIVKEVRDAGQKMFEQSGGTMKSFMAMLKREAAKREKRDAEKKRSRRLGKDPKR